MYSKLSFLNIIDLLNAFFIGAAPSGGDCSKPAAPVTPAAPVLTTAADSGAPQHDHTTPSSGKPSSTTWPSWSPKPTTAASSTTHRPPTDTTSRRPTTTTRRPTTTRKPTTTRRPATESGTNE